MTASLTAIVRGARELLDAYLTRYPAEHALFAHMRAQLDAGSTDVLMRSTMEGHITTSMVVFDPVTRMVLLIAHGIYLDWMPAGGHFERDLSLWLSAAREVLEETGVVVSKLDWCGAGSAERPIDIDTHPIAANPKKSEGAHFHHDITFVATASSLVPIVPQVAEVNDVKWVHLSTLADSPLERVRRLGAKLDAAWPQEH